jgi:3-methyladenine DNA glycosylase AlkD
MTSVVAAPSVVHAAFSSALVHCADPVKAEGMRAYMKHHFGYLGVPSPQRRTALKSVLAEYGLTKRSVVSTDWLCELASLCWRGEHREMQYLAGDVLEFFARSVTIDLFDLLIEPIFDETAAGRGHWWDSVDHFVGCVISPIALKHNITKDMRRWLIGSGTPIHKRAEGQFSPELAKVRAAILHQQQLGKHTDEKVLFEFCALRAPDKEFFVGKAIGWALRDYSYSAPAAVEQFVNSCPELTPLARREGLKVVLKRRKRAINVVM